MASLGYMTNQADQPSEHGHAALKNTSSTRIQKHRGSVPDRYCRDVEEVASRYLFFSPW